MFIRIPNSFNSLEQSIDIMYQYFRPNITATQLQHWNAEDIYGKGLCQHYKIGHYLNSILYVALLRLFIDSDKPTWVTIESKFEIEKMIKCFSCNDISLKHLFELIGLIQDGSGIETMGIENSFFIENENNNTGLQQNILTMYNEIISSECYVNPILNKDLLCQ